MVKSCELSLLNIALNRRLILLSCLNSGAASSGGPACVGLQSLCPQKPKLRDITWNSQEKRYCYVINCRRPLCSSPLEKKLGRSAFWDMPGHREPIWCLIWRSFWIWTALSCQLAIKCSPQRMRPMNQDITSGSSRCPHCEGCSFQSHAVAIIIRKDETAVKDDISLVSRREGG